MQLRNSKCVATKKCSWSDSGFVSLLNGSILDAHTQRLSSPQDFSIPFSKSAIASIQSKSFSREPPPYQKIVKSVYLTQKAQVSNLPVHKCHCFKSISRPLTAREQNSCGVIKQSLDSHKSSADTTQFCEESCDNRLLFIECTDTTCSLPNPTLCKNRHFSRREWKNIRISYFSKKGFGLVSLEKIEAGSYIIEYVGEVIDDKECERRMLRTKASGENHFYMMEISCDVVIDAQFKSNASRFINHSCEPNCESQKWIVDGSVRVGIFAIHDIDVGEEITIDYKFNYFSNQHTICFCESSRCAGSMGIKKSEAKTFHITHESAFDINQEMNQIKKRPEQLSSLALLKRHTFDSDCLTEYGFLGKRLFVARRSRYNALINSDACSSQSERRFLEEENNPEWYNFLAKNQRSKRNHSCGGLTNYDMLLHSYLEGTQHVVSKHDTKKLTIVRGLEEARIKRFRDVERFLNGRSTWNRIFQTRKQDMNPEIVHKILKVMQEGAKTLGGSVDLNDDTCYRCGQTGELVCCDKCPNAFHVTCANLCFVPPKNSQWHCPKCREKRKRRCDVGYKEEFLDGAIKERKKQCNQSHLPISVEIPSNYYDFSKIESHSIDKISPRSVQELS